MEIEHLIRALIATGILVALMGLVMWLRVLAGWPHKWRYRNPYDRTCRICGRHEVEHQWAGMPQASWWEVFDEGDESAHRKESEGVK